MKKIVLLSIVLISSLLAEVTTIVPYSVYLDYGSKSAKDSGTINGVYFSTGDLNYLTEISYSSTNISYRNSNISDLVQNEATFIYHKYTKKYATKIGFHANSTTDTDLQNGLTMIVGISSWKYYGYYKKLSYGVDYYNSYYANGQDLDQNATKVTVNQITPYVSYYQPLKTVSNKISLKANFQSIDAYSGDTSYTSFELKDRVFMKKSYFEIKYIFGKSRTGISDGGMTVYNSKDLMTNTLSLKMGYYLNKKITLSGSLTKNRFDEFGGNNNVTNQIIVGTLSYKF